MKNAQRILAVINRSDEAGFVLDKVAVLADAESASVRIIRVIFDDLVDFHHAPADEAQAMKLYIMQSEERQLVSIVDECRDRFRDIETATVWNKRISEGAIEAADEFDADLIMKAADSKSAFPRHPDDWNLLRHAQRPVMLVNPHPWQDHPVVLASADLLDNDHDELNSSILHTGAHIAAELDGLLHVVCAYPGMTTWANADANLAVDYTNMERDIQQATKSKLDTLTDNRFDADRLYMKPGRALAVVRDAVRDVKPEIVVIGNAAREGIQGFVLGNTSEALLGIIESDLLVVSS